jgi:amidase
VLSPVWTQPPFRHDWDIESAETAHATLELMRPVLPANLLGLPAAVTCGGVVDGLPVGVQVMGDRFHDLLCLDAAEAIETAVGPLTPIEPVRERRA